MMDSERGNRFMLSATSITRVSCTVVLLLAAALTGCGTAHYMVPPRPLESGRWQISVVWHYNYKSARAPLSLFLPDANAWVGLGDNSNLGIGSSFFLPGTMSYVRYFEERSERVPMVYSTLALLTAADQPFIEAGVGQSFLGATKQSVQLGLGWRIRSLWPMNQYKCVSFVPVFHYQAIGSDLGLSYAHYWDLTRRMAKASFAEIERDSILADAKDIDSVTLGEEGFIGKNVLIWLKSGLILEYESTRRYADDMNNPHWDFYVWSQTKFCIFRQLYRYMNDYPEFVVFDVAKIYAIAREKTAVTLEAYPTKLRAKIGSMSPFIYDHAIGFAPIFDPK